MRSMVFVRSTVGGAVLVGLVIAAATLPGVASAAPKKAVDPQKVFSRKDTNSDGALTLEEYKAGMKPEQVEKADKRFKKIDTDGDGKLSFEEFKAGLPKPKE